MLNSRLLNLSMSKLEKDNEQLATDLIPVMRGHDVCSSDYDSRTGKGLCEYHESKVGKSVVPGEDIYSRIDLVKIEEWLVHLAKKNLPIAEFLRIALTMVDDYWALHRNDLDERLYESHKRISEACKAEGKYLAGGWMASPHQFSQLYAVLWILKKRGVLTDESEILRCGTASSAHTRQLTGTFEMLDVDPNVTIVDVCRPPLDESAPYVAKTVVADLQTMEFVSGQFCGVTGHVIDSFIPKQAASHAEALGIKADLFKRLNGAIKKDGFLVMLIGTSPNKRRFNTEEEIAYTLEAAGFAEIFVIRTTDPLDYDEEKGTHIDGNFFVVALNR